MKQIDADPKIEAPAAGTASPVIRHVTCKTALNQSTISEYSLNCYVGCTHACAYCYARYMQRFHPHVEPWGGFVDVKTNAVEALEKQLRKARPGPVFVSSACDGWQPVEEQYRLTRECCRLLLDAGFRVNALTKSARILRDFDVFQGMDARLRYVDLPGRVAAGDLGAPCVIGRRPVPGIARRSGSGY